MVSIMASISISSIIPYKRQVHPTFKRIRQIERGRAEYILHLKKDLICPSPRLIGDTDWTGNASHQATVFAPKADRRQVICLVYNSYSLWRKTSMIPLLVVCNTKGCGKFSSGRSHQREKVYYEYNLLEKGSCERQLEELDSYFGKLHYNMDEQLRSHRNGHETIENHMETSSWFEGQLTKVDVASNLCKQKSTLDLLESYFGELNAAQRSKIGTPRSLGKENSDGPPVQMHNTVAGGYGENMTTVEPDGFERLRDMDDEASHVSSDNGNIKVLPADDEVSDFYLINLLVGINIAIFLFEIASPIRNSEIQNLSLPLAYGAKINKLIMVGEWWRLLTPMFLHSGFLHVALSCWVLLTFGPQVCRGYGPFTFLLIYVLGGICASLTSFIHTPELTVCGTGPVFAIIGAWLIYQIQNKQVVAKELSESMFWKAVTATALSFLLSSFGRIDDWTHVGAAISGIVFGFLTCPTLRLLENLSPSKNGRKQEGVALVHHQADPCKSLLVFSIFMLILSCLVFLYGTQLKLVEMEDVV